MDDGNDNCCSQNLKPMAMSKDGNLFGRSRSSTGGMDRSTTTQGRHAAEDTKKRLSPSNSGSGRGLKKLTLLPALFVMALASSHRNFHVVEATNLDHHDEGDGSLVVIEDHDTSLVEFTTGAHHFARGSGDDDDDSDDENSRIDDDEYDESGNFEEDSSDKNGDLIVVVSVDGTLAGISKETGKVLWKQSRQEIDTQQTSTMKPSRSGPEAEQARLLQPLVSTTTTTKSASTSEYAAVPSIDGNVYLTSDDVTVVSSVKDLVARSPFLDNRGRFYVGSRRTTAAALDGDTGEILRIVTTAEIPDQQDQSLDGRNTIWVGRIDYSVSVQDARTGMVDARFSVADIMSVSDMQGSKGAAAWKSFKADDAKSSSTSAADNTFTKRLRLLPAPSDESSALTASDGGPSALVATPNGNLAYRDPETSALQWVADTSFNSPIAFAMDAKSGFSLGVDIIPDVPIPNSSKEYVAREIGRQLQLMRDRQLEPEDQTIVGAMASGQLYALPLGGQTEPLPSTSLQQQHAVVASLSAANTATNLPKVPQITGGRTNLHSITQDGKQTVGTKRQCDPLSSQFPACLVGHKPSGQHSQQNRHDAIVKGSLSSDHVPPQGEDEEDPNEASITVAAGPYTTEGGFYHPDFGYVSTQDLQRIQHRMQPQSLTRKIVRIMSSWLPPTIALIFVLSFELGRRKRLKDNQRASEEQNQQNIEEEEQTDPSYDPPQSRQQHVIQVSEDVLGYGGQGTVVYKGMLDGRSVAVKRMLSAYHASADREISLLIESDGHPNVVRYFLKEVRGDFVYLALELCSLSLHDLIGILRQDSDNNTSTQINSAIYASSKSILLQIASGVRHLHSLRIVHRDLKPANILLAISRKGKLSPTNQEPVLGAFLNGLYTAKISDMGLGKQLVGQSSIGTSLMADPSLRGSKPGASSVGVGPGSVGWQAPEVMAARWTASDASARSGDSSDEVMADKIIGDAALHLRTSRSVDIFSLGCIFYSTLMPGNHPFGEWYEREANIMHNRPKLDSLKNSSPDAYDLVSGMLDRNPRLRPTARDICEHPFFWTSQKKLTFLCEFSDRLETDACTDTPGATFHALAIERCAAEVVGTAWDQHLDEALISNVHKFRTYDTTSVRDLLRLIRNKHHHFDELPTEFREVNACNADAFLEYFEARFPLLLMHCFDCCRRLMTKEDPLAMKFSIVPLLTREARSTSGVAVVRVQSSIGEKGVEWNDDVPALDDVAEKIAVSEGTKNGTTDHAIVNEASGEGMADVEMNGNDQPSSVAMGADNFLDADNIIAWEGSTVAKSFNCRGWSRSAEEWSTRIDPWFRKCDQQLLRGVEDHKFRTRLCNHWDESHGTFCPMRKKGKCVFAHGPVELRVKEQKKNRWGKLLDKNGNNSNPCHSGGEDTYGAARSIESARKVEGKWNTPRKGSTSRGKKQPNQTPKKKNTSQ